MFCPYYKNKEVFDSFNSMIQAFGGQPMTEDEFKSAYLRNQRVGLDLSAMEAAYRLYDKNGGLFLDKVPNSQSKENPNGVDSRLFSDILAKNNGDYLKSIKEKAQYYSKRYTNTYGDWLLNKPNENSYLDVNNEPIMNNERASIAHFSANQTFGDNIGKHDPVTKLFAGEVVSSRYLLQYFLDTDTFSLKNKILAKVLSRHDIPVRLNNSISADANSTIVNGYRYIEFNGNVLRNYSNRYVANTLIHEIVHQLTTKALSSPQTKEEKDLQRNVKKFYDYINKHFKNFSSILSDVDGQLYAMSDEFEFIAELASDEYAREQIYKIANLIDNNKNIVVRTLNNIINSISKILVGRSVVGSVKEFEKISKQVEDFLMSRTVIENSKPSDQETIDYYNDIMENMSEYDRVGENVKHLNKSIDYIDRRYKKSSNGGDTYYQNIRNSLSVRLNAIRTSSLDASKKANLTNSTQSQIDLFTISTMSQYDTITSFLRQVVPQLIQDKQEICDIYYKHKNFTSNDYMFQMHSNIKMYDSIVEQLQLMLSKDGNIQQIVDLYNKGKIDKDKISVDDLLNIKQDVDNLSSVTTAAKAVLDHMLDTISYDKMKSISESVGAREGVKYADSFIMHEIINDDISVRQLYAGASDSSSNEAVRVISHMVNKAIENADNDTIPVGLAMLNAVKNLKRGESQLQLYELDENGQTTGYLVRNLNYGKFWRNYDKALTDINRAVTKQFSKDGLILKDDNRFPPDEHEDARVMWNDMRNKWLSENAHRKYTSEYYKIQSDVPYSARKALDQYDSQIQSLLSKPGVIDENGIKHFDVLTDDEWERLKAAWRDKAMLYEDYTIFGVLKTGEELKIARSLQNFRKKLNDYREKKTGKKFNPIYDQEGWQKQFDKIIEECGGKKEFNKWMQEGFNLKFDDQKFLKWARRNARLQFKKDEDGNAIVFEKIKEAMRGISIDFGKEYDELKEKRQALLRPHKDQYGEIDGNNIPESVRNILMDIKSQMLDIRNQVLSENQQISKLYYKYSELMDEYITRENTEYYNDVERSIDNMLLEDDIDDPGVRYAMLLDYGYDPDDTGEFIQPDDWWVKTVATDKLEYMEFTPGKGWMLQQDESVFLDPMYEKLSKEEGNNSSFIPKKRLYDNSQAFEKIKSSEGLYNLYKLTLEYMKKSNEMQTNRMFTDDYLLPQMQGSLWKRLKRSRNKWSVFIEWLKEQIGISQSVDDSVQYGESSALDENSDEYGNNKEVSSIGKYPDGRRFNILPQYYTRKLQNPSQLSSDLVKMITTYYNMSSLYKYKSEVRDDVESLIDAIGKQKFAQDYAQFSTKKTTVDGINSKTFEFINKWVEMNLYDKARLKFNLNKGGININFDKTLQLSRRYITARNLGLNPKVAVVGFLTTMYNHIVYTLTGQRYSTKETLASVLDVASRTLFKHLLGARTIGNPYTKDKMLVIMSNFGMANQWDNTISHTNRNRFVQAAFKQSIYGFMSTADILSKQQITQSTLRAHHYVNGEFLTKYDIRMRRVKNGEDWFNNAMSQYNKNKSLWDLIDTSTGQIKITGDNPDYKAAYKKSEFKIKSRCVKYAEEADGMATPLQRSLLVRSWAGVLVMLHRQYFPLMLDKYFGKRVYDYDMQEYKNGLHRNIFDLLSSLTGHNIITSGLIWGSVGTLFLGPVLGGGIGTVAGIINHMHIRNKNKANGIKPKSIKKAFKDYIDNKSSDEAYVKSLSNKYQLKQTASEIALYIGVSQLAVLATAYAKSSDDDDEWWKYMLAYWLEAFKWEAFNPYRIDDISNNFKTVSAATSITDALGAIGQGTASGVMNRFFPRASMLYDPSLMQNIGDEAEDYFTTPLGSRSRTYEGYSKAFRDVMKATPLHSIPEQMYDSKSKLNYLKTQIERERIN